MRRVLRVTQPAQVVPMLCPSWPNLERGTPGLGSISSVLTSLAQKPRVEGMLSLHLPAAPVDAVATATPPPVQAMILQLRSPWAQL